MSEQSTDIIRQIAARRRSEHTSEPTKNTGSDVHPLLRLQAQVGNAHIARLLAQRAAPEDDEVHAKHDEAVGIEGGPVGPDTASRIKSMRGGGSPLDDQTRTSMEGALGTSFADVRVHSGSDADTLNRRLTARAFTTGSDIFLRGDASPTDTHLMAHELTHVVQQRSLSGGGGMTVGAAGNAHEAHADAVADAVNVSTPAQASAAPAAQRDTVAEGEVQAEHDALAQRAAPEEDELKAQHDLAQRAELDEEEPG
jgi:Domain of unknown function (DUF4157)